MTRTKVHM